MLGKTRGMEPGMIKLFACDLDGTLLNLFHTTDDKILAAIREITDAGAHVAAATGRTSVWYTDGGFEPGTIEAICANGSIIRGRDGEVLKSYIVDPAFLEELIPAFPGICFDCVTSDSILSSNTREVREAGFVTDSPWRRILMRGMRAKASFLAHHRYEVPLAEILQHDVCKVNCRVPDPGMERELHAFLAEHADTVVNAPFNPAMFEITDRACNKGESVAWLANYLGFSEDEVAVYGDGGNDIVMLDRFEHAYATSNGSDAAKRAAGNVIGNCAAHAVPRHMGATLRNDRNRTVIS